MSSSDDANCSIPLSVYPGPLLFLTNLSQFASFARCLYGVNFITEMGLFLLFVLLLPGIPPKAARPALRCLFAFANTRAYRLLKNNLK